MIDFPREHWQEAAMWITTAVGEIETAWTSPFTRVRPKLSKDGDQYCFLYGENIVDGVAGFGSTPAEAEENFNKAWAGK